MAEDKTPKEQPEQKAPDFKEFLTGRLGVQNADELLDPGKYDPELVKAAIFDRAGEVLRDDAEFTKNLAEKGAQETRGKLIENVANQFNVKAEELQEKSIEEILSYARSRVSQNSDSRVKELDEEVARLKREVKHRDDVTIPAIEQKANEKWREVVKQSMVEDAMAGLDLVVSKTFARSGLMEHLQNKYRVEADAENRILKITNKAGEPIRGEDTQKLSVQDIIKREADALGILRKQKGQGGNFSLPQGGGAEKQKETGGGQNNWANPNAYSSRTAARENLQRQLKKLGVAN